MYYAEQIVDGILCHRSTPDGRWIQFTQKELTEKVLSYQQALYDAKQLKVEQGG